MVSNGGNASCASLWSSESPRKSFRRNILREITEVFAYVRCRPAQLGWKQVRTEWWMQTASAEAGTALHSFHLQACQNFACQRPNYIHRLRVSSEPPVHLSVSQMSCLSISVSVSHLERLTLQLRDRNPGRSQKMNKCNSNRPCCCSPWTKAHWWGTCLVKCHLSSCKLWQPSQGDG